MESPKIVIEIPKEVNKKMKEFQDLMVELRQPRPKKRELINAILDLYGPRWLDQRIAIVKEAVEAVAKI